MNDDTKFALLCAFILGISLGGLMANAITDKDYIVAIPVSICLAIIVLRLDYILAKLEKIFSSS